MKLILSVDAINPPLTGVGRYAWELVTRLSNRPELESLRFYLNGRWIADPASLLQEAHAAKPKRRRKVKVPKWYTDWRSSSAFRSSIFHSPNYFLPAHSGIAVATIHDLSIIKFPETHPMERRQKFDRELSGTLDRASHLITPSEAIRKEVIEYFSWPADKVTAVANGVAPSFNSKQSSEILIPTLSRCGLRPNEYALCVSTLEPRKNIGALLRAYSRLSETLRARYPLVLAGHKGWLSESLHDSIDKGRSEGWLHYLGFVPEADLPALYAGARAFLYPSLYEGFGLPVLEAMASGVPVLTSDSSSLPEVSNGAALLIDPNDDDLLYKGIDRILLDDDWRALAKARGLEVAARFSWERCIEQTMAVYTRLSPAL